MNALKEKIINEIIRIEGGFVDDSSDSGGATNFGITESVARSFGYTGSMRDMPRSVAYDIYAAKYWDSVHADGLSELSERITEEVVDTAVNMGPGRAGEFLQRSLNVLNNLGSLYPDIVVDNAIGKATASALKQFLFYRGKEGEEMLAKMLNCLQGAFYVELAERREKDEKFIYGWFKNRVKLQ